MLRFVPKAVPTVIKPEIVTPVAPALVEEVAPIAAMASAAPVEMKQQLNADLQPEGRSADFYGDGWLAEVRPDGVKIRREARRPDGSEDLKATAAWQLTSSGTGSRLYVFVLRLDEDSVNAALPQPVVIPEPVPLMEAAPQPQAIEIAPSGETSP